MFRILQDSEQNETHVLTDHRLLGSLRGENDLGHLVNSVKTDVHTYNGNHELQGKQEERESTPRKHDGGKSCAMRTEQSEDVIERAVRGASRAEYSDSARSRRKPKCAHQTVTSCSKAAFVDGRLVVLTFSDTPAFVSTPT